MRSTAASSDPERRLIGSSVLVGYDGGERAADALELGRLIALSAGARATAVHVSPRVGSAAKALRPLRDAFGIAVIDSRSAVDGLTTAARMHDATVIVLGTSHRGLVTQTLLGSKAERLVAARLCPVAIAPRGYDTRYANRMLRIVVVGFDGSPDSHHAREIAGEIVDANNGTVQVIDLDPSDPASHLVSAAGAETDLLVIGSSSYRRFATFFLRGVPGALHPGARCPVLIAPRPDSGTSSPSSA